MARKMTQEQKDKMKAAREAKAQAKAAEGEQAEETKAGKFVRLARARVNKAVKYIAAVGNLAGNGYESTPEQRQKVVDYLKKAVNDTEALLTRKGAVKDGFVL